MRLMTRFGSQLPPGALILERRYGLIFCVTFCSWPYFSAAVFNAARLSSNFSPIILSMLQKSPNNFEM